MLKTGIEAFCLSLDLFTSTSTSTSRLSNQLLKVAKSDALFHLTNVSVTIVPKNKSKESKS